MDPKRFTRRLVALGAVMFLCALVFVVTLFDAQIVNGDDYLAQSVRANAKVEDVYKRQQQVAAERTAHGAVGLPIVAAELLRFKAGEDMPRRVVHDAVSARAHHARDGRREKGFPQPRAAGEHG